MKESNWVNHLREAFAAVAAGGQIVPLGDNGEVRQSLAARLAEMRLNARLAGLPSMRPPMHQDGEEY
jgi:hypothetical protein